MRLSGDVDALAAVDTLLAPPAGRGAVQGREQRDERGGRRGVGDRATPATGDGELRAEPDRAREAVEQGLLHLGPGGGGRPEHPLAAQAAREEVTEQRGECRVRREVAEERRVLPVQGRGGDDAVEGAEQRLERLRVLREEVRQPCANLTGDDLGAHRAVRQPGAVRGDPVHDGVAQPAELVGVQIGHVVDTRLPVPGKGTLQ
jgi:hypothetical protein